MLLNPFRFKLPAAWKDGASRGNLPSTGNWTELSGLARPIASANSGYLWGQADGSVDFLLAIDASDGTDAGELTLSGVAGVDHEDMDSASVGGVDYIYLADIGDNSDARSDFDIYRIVEPTITGSDFTVSSGDIEQITCVYSGTAPSHKDAECLMVDPATGDMYIITKRETVPGVYKLAHASSYAGTQNFVFQGDMYDIPDSYNTASGGNSGNVVAGSISPDGTEILVKSYSHVYLFTRDPQTQTIFEALEGTPTILPSYVGGAVDSSNPVSHPSQEPQGEAICWSPDGRDYYTCSEYAASHGSSQGNPLYYYERTPAVPTVIEFQDGVYPTAGYAGTRDTYIWDLNPTTSYGTATTFISDINASDERRGLIKFDISSIPAGATIVGAYIDLFINTEGQGWRFHKALVSWSESSTYDSLTGGMDADDVDASIAHDVDIGRNLDTLTIHVRNNIPIATVQGWLDTPSTNHGYLVLATHATDGQQHRSREHATTSTRPRLYVRYLT